MVKIIRTNDSRGPSLGARRRATESGSIDMMTSEMVMMAEAEAERIVQAGRTRASEIVDDAMTTLQSATEKLRQAEAQAEQTAESRQKLDEERQQLLNEEVVLTRKKLQNLVEQVEAQKQVWCEANHVESVDLALAIAEQILRHHLDQDSNTVVAATRDGLQWVAGANKITVRLSPDATSKQHDLIADALRDLHPAAECEVVQDPDVTLGGSRIETEFGSIDQTIEAQLSRIAEELRDA